MNDVVMFFLFLFYICYLFTLVVYFDYIRWFFRFDKSSYKKETNNSFYDTVISNDKGLIGEFETFRLLEEVPGDKRILVNLYLPVSENETTEIDLVFIHGTGIYVIESKNFSGYIYGNEKHMEWCQVLNKKTKNKFFNPIWQNSRHINYLRRYLNIDSNVPIISIVVFSYRCTLKKITYSSENVVVLKRNELKNYLSQRIINAEYIYSTDQIEKIYNSLKPVSNQSKEVKEKHISAIKMKHKIKSED